MNLANIILFAFNNLHTNDTITIETNSIAWWFSEKSWRENIIICLRLLHFWKWWRGNSEKQCWGFQGDISQPEGVGWYEASVDENQNIGVIGWYSLWSGTFRTSEDIASQRWIACCFGSLQKKNSFWTEYAHNYKTQISRSGKSNRNKNVAAVFYEKCGVHFRTYQISWKTRI